MSADAIVEVKKIGKIYDGGVEALKDASLELPGAGSARLWALAGAVRQRSLKSSPG